MASTNGFRGASIAVIDYRCEVQPDDAPFVELHDSFSLAYVRKGTLVAKPEVDPSSWCRARS